MDHMQTPLDVNFRFILISIKWICNRIVFLKKCNVHQSVIFDWRFTAYNTKLLLIYLRGCVDFGHKFLSWFFEFFSQFLALIYQDSFLHLKLSQILLILLDFFIFNYVGFYLYILLSWRWWICLLFFLSYLLCAFLYL